MTHFFIGSQIQQFLEKSYLYVLSVCGSLKMLKQIKIINSYVLKLLI